MLFGLDEICLIPAPLSTVEHRRNVNVFTNKNNYPIFTAPMASIVDQTNINTLKEHKLNVIVPRSVDFKLRLTFFKNGEWVAFGFREADVIYETLEIKEGVVLRMCIDQANGHMESLINLCKKYKDQMAVDNVSMTIRKGDIYGFIGQNGAGKTSLIRMITGLAHRTSGEIELFGGSGEEALNKGREFIGSLIESPAFYKNMTARENLEVSRLVRNIPGKECIDEVLNLVGLKDTGKKKVKDFSLGMRQRLGIANALLGNPKLLILDEPINGLDPMGIIEIRELLKKINKEKDITILISSHILGELSELATTYGIISNGKLIEEISSSELSQKCRQYIDIKVDDAKKAVILLERQFGITDYEVLENNKIKIFSHLNETGAINMQLSKGGVVVEKIDIKGEKLEEYFMDRVGGEVSV